MSKTAQLLVWRVYLLLGFLQGMVALIGLSQGRSEFESVFFLGFSRTRFLSLLGVFLISAILGWLWIESWMKTARSTARLERLTIWLCKSKVWGIVVIILGLILLLSIFFITLTPEVIEPFTRAYFERLLPIVAWICGLSFQTLAAVLFLGQRSGAIELKLKGKAFYITLGGVALLFLAWSWAVQATVPQESKIIGWNSLGVPILGTQVLLAWFVGLVMLALTLAIPGKREQIAWLQKIKPQRFDLFISLFLWLASVILWQSIPLKPSWFVSERRPPNAEYYPNSDAFRYDAGAQNAMVGAGFRFFETPYIRRPMINMFFTTLHVIGGQDYETVVLLQILVLALLPPLIYWLIKILHTRTSAIMAAVMILLREANSIAVTDRITTSNAKLLMADFPAMLVIVGFVLATITWLKQVENGELRAVLAGGVLGIAMLIRLETFILALAVAGISAGILFRRRRRLYWLKSMSLFGLGVALVISPWIWRNWNLTGLIFIDSPISRMDLIAQRYRENPGVVITPPSMQETENAIQQTTATSESEPATSQAPIVTPIPSMPQATVPAEKPLPWYETFINTVTVQTIEYILSDPGRVASFIITHYANSQMQTLLLLPTTYRGIDSLMGFMGHKSTEKFWYDCCSVHSYIRRLPFWHKWDGYLPKQTLIPLLINILVIATGISEAWRRERILGLTPLVIQISYILLNASLRNSGGRYILPVDWVSVFYFSIGLAHLSQKGMELILGCKVGGEFSSTDENISTTLREPKPSGAPKNLLQKPGFYGLSILFLLLGCALPLTEKAFPALYTEARKQTMLTTLMQSDLLTEPERQTLETFLSNGGNVLIGRAMYPRFFKAGNDEVGSHNLLGPKEYSRLAFYLAGPVSLNMYLLAEESPAFFPNASDVIVIGCSTGEALATGVFSPSGNLAIAVIRFPLPEILSCPLKLP